MTEPVWNISPPVVGDCDELGRVHVQVWRQAYSGLMPDDYLADLSGSRFAASWRRRLEQPTPAGRQSLTLVAHGAQGSIVGFASAGPTRDADAPTAWELYALNLLREAQGTGLAGVLLDQVLGDRPATLWVAERNARARAFYARHGFVDEGGRCVHDASGIDEVRMMRSEQA